MAPLYIPINVMALTLNYCFCVEMGLDGSKQFALNVLFHDIGKTEVPDEILTSSRRLTQEEFGVMKRHPSIGAEILKQESGECSQAFWAVLHHHERLDRTGYPQGLGNGSISEYGQIVGAIDCYEALTNDDRPYRSAMRPIEALKLMKSHTDDGKYDRKYLSKKLYGVIIRLPQLGRGPSRRFWAPGSEPPPAPYVSSPST